MNKNVRITLLLSAFFLSFFLMLALDSIWYVFFILMFVSLGTLIYTNIKHEDKFRLNVHEECEKALKNAEFKYDDYQIANDKLSIIAISEQEERLLILKRNTLKDNFKSNVINFNEIIESVIVEDGESIMKSSMGGTVGRAVVGSAVAGGVGAIIGGLSADKTSKETVRKVTLSIVVNSLLNPIHELTFLNSLNPIMKNSLVYKDSYEQAYRWHKIMSVIIKRNEMNSSIS